MMTNEPNAHHIFSHVTIGANDIAGITPFYDAVLAVIGLARHKTFKAAVGYAPDGFAHPTLPVWILRPQDRQPAQAGNGGMVAFHAPTRAAVDAFHAAAVAHGGTDEGVPGLRRQYHQNFYGAYVRDPAGNKLCAVCHSPED